MAVENASYWTHAKRRISLSPPIPETWVVLVIEHDVFYDDELPVFPWLEDTSLEGEYCWTYVQWDGPCMATRWAFSDHRTAMAFKMRWG